MRKLFSFGNFFLFYILPAKLFLAAERGSTSQIRLLLKHKADHQIRNNVGKIPLDISVQKIDAENVTRLRLVKFNEEMDESEMETIENDGEIPNLENIVVNSGSSSKFAQGSSTLLSSLNANVTNVTQKVTQNWDKIRKMGEFGSKSDIWPKK